ncbi:MAG: S8 family serine peptidase [Eubacteriaceae bacterium]|nr:S8 family serine peptidase [Eubacteriaceae bacterium]
MRIALIDNSEDLKNQTRDEGCVCSDCYIKKGSVYDKKFCVLNHALICSNIIKKYTYDNVNIIARKVFESDNLQCSLKKLIKELKWCEKNDIQIINLSLGSIVPRDFEQLNSICKKLYNKGIIVVAGISNNKHITMPACSKYSIGVEVDESLKNDSYYWNRDSNVFSASGVHNLRIDENYNFTTPAYSSFAVPMITAKVVNIVKENSDTEMATVINELRKRTKRKQENKNVLISHCKIEIPIIRVVGNKQIAKNLTRLFRKKNYNVLYDGGSMETKNIFNIYNTYGCDMIIICGNGNGMTIKEDICVEVDKNTIKIIAKDEKKSKALFFFKSIRVYMYLKKF